MEVEGFSSAEKFRGSFWFLTARSIFTFCDSLVASVVCFL
jgi:hypothetical protein